MYFFANSTYTYSKYNVAFVHFMNILIFEHIFPLLHLQSGQYKEKSTFTEAYYCHPHVKILTCHVNIIRNQKAICWHVGIV